MEKENSAFRRNRYTRAELYGIRTRLQMTPELKETVSRYLDSVPVPPVICSDYSAFDAIAEITGFRVSTREELFESPIPEIITFEATVKF